MRVTSRTPCPDSTRCSGGAPASAPATSAATTWGRWEVRATAWSCSSGLNVNGVAPQASARAVTRSTAAERRVACGATAQGRPSNSTDDAASGPDRSLPAIGWLPT